MWADSQKYWRREIFANALYKHCKVGFLQCFKCSKGLFVLMPVNNEGLKHLLYITLLQK